jgi:acetylornithine deacetylase
MSIPTKRLRRCCATRTMSADVTALSEPRSLTALERQVAARIAERRQELVALVCELIGYDTRTHVVGDPPRQELELQTSLARRLERAGADVVVAEPDVAVIADHGVVPEHFSFAGRPQLVARLAGAGGGRTLLLNGHVDVVDADPQDGWSSPPFAGEVRDGAVWGRGACDMKGGVASMVIAAETLAEMGITLRGDVLVNTVTDEESTGAGGLVSARTLRADGAIVPEPTGLGIAIACRGSLLPTLTVEGRTGHAGAPPRHHDDGGNVNAIDKAIYLIEAVRRLCDDWALRPAHPYLAPADCVTTSIHGGDWIVSYPASCVVNFHIEYLPASDGGDPAAEVRAEFEDWVMRAAAADPWLRAHPPRVQWLVGGVPPAAVAHDALIVQSLASADRAFGRPGELAGFDNWHDGASLIVEGGIPSVCYGPGRLAVAHTVDEHVPVDDLVSCCQGIAVAAMRFCELDG